MTGGAGDERPASDAPTLETARLRLRPFRLADASVLAGLAGDDAIASTVPVIPHPYQVHDAETWIQRHREAWERGRSIELAIALAADGTLVGAVGLGVDAGHERGELGYWVGRPYWGRGYATEAARALLRYAFDELGLHRVQAHHLARNPASGAVLRKIGMRAEGVQRGFLKHRGRFEDVALYGVLRTDPPPPREPTQPIQPTGRPA